MFSTDMLLTTIILICHMVLVTPADTGDELSEGRVNLKNDWHHEVKDTYIPTDLNTTPLYLKTSSVLGSGEGVRVVFYDEHNQNQAAGGIYLYFDTTIEYFLRYCTSWTPLPVTPSTSQDKIWKISVTAGPRVIVECNRVEVLNIVLDSSVCDNSYYRSIWNYYWGRGVSSIRFSSSDDATDKYCVGNNCA